MNDALELYASDKDVASVSGYLYPVKNSSNTFFINCINSWGWGTWKNSWKNFEKDGSKLLRELEMKGLIKEFDFNNSFDYSKMLKDQIAGKNSSWAIRWYASNFLKKKLTLFPPKSLIQNMGVDGSGTHGGKVNVYETRLFSSPIVIKRIPVVEDLNMRKNFEQFFIKSHMRVYKLFLLIKKIVFGNNSSQ